MATQKTYRLGMVLAFAGAIFFGCHKDDHHPTTPATVQSHKWDTIAGHYKVFDTMGQFLYEMDLIHKTGCNVYGNLEDSLIFSNFDGKFTFSNAQWTPAPSNFPMAINIGSHNPISDTNNKRWDLGGGVSDADNNFKHDTIRLRFQITNINYWIEDATPYYSCDCKQIAVKQH